MGAVNTVVNREGRLLRLQHRLAGGYDRFKAKTGLQGEHVLILGAGGASRAIAFGILEEGGRVTLTDLDAPGPQPWPGTWRWRPSPWTRWRNARPPSW